MVGALVIGRGSFAPGWRWSHTARAPSQGERPPDHVGVVLSGRVKVVIQDSNEIDLTPGDFFHIATEFESWVVGHRPCEILYLNGAGTNDAPSWRTDLVRFCGTDGSRCGTGASRRVR